MIWIESHDELPTHPKTRKLARRLDISAPCAVGHLHFLWWWCITHRPDGMLDDMDADDIADAAGWDAEPEPFVKALIQSGWLDDDGSWLMVHDWWEGAGKTILRRRNASERQRRAREAQESHEPSRESPVSNGDVTRDKSVSNGADSDSDIDSDIDKIKTSTTKAKRATQFPDGWKPNDKHRQLASELGVDTADQAQRFEDHHVAKGSTFKDWDRAFNNWLRNSVSFGTTGKGSRTPKSIDDEWAGAESGRAQL